LIDGVLVRKTVGFYESRLTVVLAAKLASFVRKKRSGVVLGPDGQLRILALQVRAPDICFIGWPRFPGGKQPIEGIPKLIPDLAIEVLSISNTKREMDRTLDDFFAAGVRLVWYIDPRARTARVYTSATECSEIPTNGSLDGGDVLPGFKVSLAKLFREADRMG
jgi:Uma2 family endonuclease